MDEIVERLKLAFDEVHEGGKWRSYDERDTMLAQAAISVTNDALAHLQAENERLRAALEPFVEELGRFGIGNTSAHVELRLSGRRAIPNLELSVAHFEAARRAISGGDT